MRPPAIVYCDFDGTVTLEDVTDVLLTQLADPGWRAIEAQWQHGLIGSRECMAKQIPLIRGGWNAIAATLRHAKLDPTFRPFALWCRANRIPVKIVSDGLDRVVRTLLNRDGVIVDAVWANHLEESPTGELSLTFPYPADSNHCDAGLCKCQILAQGTPAPVRVIVGDGRSDVCWAQHADWLFAKSDLLTHCRINGIPCRPFEDFETVRRALESLLTTGVRQPSLRPAGTG